MTDVEPTSMAHVAAATSSPGSDEARIVAPLLHLLSDPLDLTVDEPLSSDEAHYVAASRAANTLRGYRSDWAEFTAHCAARGEDPLPASAAAISTYLTQLAVAGAKVGTIGRRLASIRFAHAAAGVPDPTRVPRVTMVWEGIRRDHEEPPEQSTPLMPPVLFDVVDACPTTRTFATRPAETDLAGLRDRALLLVGFWGALRRAELADLTVTQIRAHDRGLVAVLPRSKTNQFGDKPELVVLPRARAATPERCPVLALQAWLEVARIDSGPVLRKVSTGNRVLDRPLHPESINKRVQAAVARAGIHDGNYSAHSLRAGFVTYAHLRGATDHQIAHQTRHRSVASVGTYIRVEEAWDDNAATMLGL